MQSISFDLAQGLFEQKCLDEADAVYRRMLKEDESDVSAMVGLARNMIERGDYSSAIGILDRSVKYDADYASSYKMRSRAYDRSGETDKAIDDAITYYEKDSDAFGSEQLRVMMKHRTYAVAKAKAMARSSEDQSQWRVLLLTLYEQSSPPRRLRWYPSCCLGVQPSRLRRAQRSTKGLTVLPYSPSPIR